MLMKKCCICGLYGNGIMLKGKKICLQCESNIAACNMNSEKYEFYIQQLKKILLVYL